MRNFRNPGSSTWASRALLRLDRLGSLAYCGNHMNNLSDDCLFQDAPTVEVADAPSMSILEEYQLLGYSSPAAISTYSEVEPSLSVGEDRKLAGAVGRLNVVESAPRLSGTACKRYKKLREFHATWLGSKF